MCNVSTAMFFLRGFQVHLTALMKPPSPRDSSILLRWRPSNILKETTQQVSSTLAQMYFQQLRQESCVWRGAITSQHSVLILWLDYLFFLLIRYLNKSHYAVLSLFSAFDEGIFLCFSQHHSYPDHMEVIDAIGYFSLILLESTENYNIIILTHIGPL